MAGINVLHHDKQTAGKCASAIFSGHVASSRAIPSSWHYAHYTPYAEEELSHYRFAIQQYPKCLVGW